MTQTRISDLKINKTPQQDFRKNKEDANSIPSTIWNQTFFIHLN